MSKKKKTSAKPAAPQVKKIKTPTVASAKSVGARLATKPVASRKKAPPRPVAKDPVVSKDPEAPAKVTGVEYVPEEITITAQIDVGFGNQLFIRGEGAGLSWNSGLQMECAFDDQWTIKLTPAYGPVSFKFLLNDLSWSDGENYIAHPGGVLVLAPSFL